MAIMVSLSFSHNGAKFINWIHRVLFVEFDPSHSEKFLACDGDAVAPAEVDVLDFPFMDIMGMDFGEFVAFDVAGLGGFVGVGGDVGSEGGPGLLFDESWGPFGDNPSAYAAGSAMSRRGFRVGVSPISGAEWRRGSVLRICS